MASKKETTKNKPRYSAKAKDIRKRKPIDKPLVIEVVNIAILAFSLLLMLSIYTSQGAGAIGQAISSVTKGLFGIGAYLIPIITIFVSIYILLTENKYFSLLQISMAMLLFTVIISFFHVAANSTLPVYSNAVELVQSNYKGGSLSNGGLFGAIFGMFFLTIFGKAGAFILFTTLGAVAVMVLTGHSLINFLRTAKDTVYQKFMVEDDIENEVVEESPIRVESMKHKKIKVYDTTPIVRKTKPFDYVVDEVEHSSNEDEIHIIERGKKITRDNLYRLKKEKVITIKEEAKKTSKNNIKSEKEKEAKKETEIRRESEIKKEIEKESKIIKEEFFVSPKLNFDVIIEDDDIQSTFEQQEIPEINGYSKTTKPEKQISKTKYKEIDTLTDVYDEEYEDYDINFVEAKPSRVVKSIASSAEYQFPKLEFLIENPNGDSIVSKSQILENSKKLEDTLKSFGVAAKVMEVSQGPTVTRYELSPGQGVKVSKISGLADDLALNLAATGIRIEAPIPGKAVVGIEVPNKEIQSVHLREVIGVEDFSEYPSSLAFALGKDIAGNTVIADITKMPHLLIAGATGSGKSVCINTLITSILYKSKPDEVKLLMIDPKVVELSIYNGIPHLLIPVVTDPKKAAGALNWAVKEMVERYNCFAESSVRDLNGYNNFLKENGEQPLPKIVIIVDELADLMMIAQNEAEDAICRLAQMARAAGIHLVIATQRPSVDVITGLIKANIPSRIAFSVSSGTDSRTILDMTGAEKLLGKGDMLFYPMGMNKPLRVQGSLISDKEVETIVGFLKGNNPDNYDTDMVEEITSSSRTGIGGNGAEDELFIEAVNFIVQKDKVSALMIQRRFGIAHKRAALIMEDLENRGFVSQSDGSKSRRVILTPVEWIDYKERNRLY